MPFKEFLLLPVVLTFGLLLSHASIQHILYTCMFVFSSIYICSTKSSVGTKKIGLH